jgi:chemotaxis signal transduction protein
VSRSPLDLFEFHEPGPVPEPKRQLLLVRLGERRFGLRLESVVEVMPVADITPLPGRADALLGVADLRGKAVPVLDTARRMGLSVRQAEADRFVLCRSATGPLALLVSSVEGLRGLEAEAKADPEAARPALPHGPVTEALLSEEGLVLVIDPDALAPVEAPAGNDG